MNKLNFDFVVQSYGFLTLQYGKTTDEYEIYCSINELETCFRCSIYYWLVVVLIVFFVFFQEDDKLIASHDKKHHKISVNKKVLIFSSVFKCSRYYTEML